jgi:Carboxypeptidase regulatory-like domain/TonB dependent receptor/TonB-dependent Receptor Plug Domain
MHISLRKPLFVVPTVVVHLSVLWFSGSAFAQIDQGAIVGTVYDKSGAVVPAAKVAATDEATGLELTTTTQHDGSYVFNPMKIGTYDVTVEKAGFAKVTQSNILVNVGSQVKANITLQTGAVTQNVEVAGAIPLLQTQTTSVGQSINAQQVTDLPLNGRNYTYLAQISAGVTTNNSRVGGTGGFTANGLQWSHNSYILDGIDNNNDSVDYLNGAAFVVLTPPDAVQEVRVQTSNFSAEFGRAGSAVLQATTKSGTNQFHGNMWEFLRNDLFDANSFFNNLNGVKKPKLRQNQFGFTVGGPIIHNKTFFFGDYQGTLIRQQSENSGTVPTANMLSSSFTNFQEEIFDQSGTRTDALGRTFPTGSILDPATTRNVTAGQIDTVTGLVAKSTGTIRDPFYQGSIAGLTNFATPAAEALMNILPANRLDANAIKLLSAYPGPNVTPASFNNFGLTSNYQVLRPQPDNTHQLDIRVDENFSEKDQAFTRFSYSHRLRNILNTFIGPIDNSGFGNGNFTDSSWNAAVSETHVFSPRMINEARIGYNRLISDALPDIASVQGVPAQFGIQGAPQGPTLGGLPLLNISGLTAVGPGEFASPNTRLNNTFQLTENLTKIYHSHTFKGGFEGQLLRFAWDDPSDSRGRMDYGTNYTGIPSGGGVGLGIAAMLLTPIKATVPGGTDYVGGPNFIRTSSNAYPDEIRHYYGLYFQDDWMVTKNMTINLGVRWEFFGQPRGRKGEAMLIPQSLSGPATYFISSNLQNVALSPALTSLLTKDGISLAYSSVPGLLNTPKNNFAPRLGLAYQITPKLVSRASYGMFYSGFENIGGAPDPGYNYPLETQPSLSDNTSGRQPIYQQYPTLFGSPLALTLANSLNYTIPDPNSPAFNPNGISFESFASPWKTGNTQEWSEFLQYALTAHDSIQVGYIGNHSVHQLNGWRLNNPGVILPPGTNTTNYVPFPDFGQGMDYVIPNGDSFYHGLQITYERRMFTGLYVLANFTRSRCKLDFRNILNDQNPGGGTFARAPRILGQKGDYSYCGDDSPRILHTAVNWELPFGHGRMFGTHMPGFINEVIGDWDVNGIYTAQDGFPGTVGCPVSTVAGFGCNALVNNGVSRYAHQGPHGMNHFLNYAAFASPPKALTIGQSDLSPLGGFPTQYHGPGYNNLDFSIFKEFPLLERQRKGGSQRRFEFRSEFFNFLNHPNFGNPGSLDFTQDPSSPNFNFARITGGRGGPRTVQLALKLYW